MTLSCGIGLSSTKRFLYFVLLFNIPVCVYGQQQLKTAHFPARYMNEAASPDGKLVFYFFYFKRELAWDEGGNERPNFPSRCQFAASSCLRSFCLFKYMYGFFLVSTGVRWSDVFSAHVVKLLIPILSQHWWRFNLLLMFASKTFVFRPAIDRIYRSSMSRGLSTRQHAAIYSCT